MGRGLKGIVMAGMALAAIGVALSIVRAAAPTTAAPASRPATTSVHGPDVVVLKELAALYDAVPFDHKSHARMADMWDGCTTCHHRSPTTQSATKPVGPVTQEVSATIPACKSCHPVAEVSGAINMPNLKGAYHRQCLSCHREWMHGNACVICHKQKDAAVTQRAQPTRDDIVGRMHPPIPEPESKTYRTRFTPADGGNVLFRHKEHAGGFGIKCVTCHTRDNCAHCHDPKADTASQKPVRPGKTWRESHGPCVNCHQQDRCNHCHYKDDQQPPAVFAHETTGQALDADHSKLACAACHGGLKLNEKPGCGEAACHKSGKLLAFPAQRPGAVVATRPATGPATTWPATTQAVTRPTLERIRR